MKSSSPIDWRSLLKAWLTAEGVTEKSPENKTATELPKDAKVIRMPLLSDTMTERKNVPDVRLRPTMASFGSAGKNIELITGMSRRTVARHNRIFATNSSPATPASARTGSSIA
jgi:hypothetical protein